MTTDGDEDAIAAAHHRGTRGSTRGKGPGGSTRAGISSRHIYRGLSSESLARWLGQLVGAAAASARVRRQKFRVFEIF